MSSTSMFQQILEIFKSADGNIIDTCTKSGEMKMANLTFENSSLLAFFPDGDYKTTFRFYDSFDANIYNITYYTTR